jgi:hypothetical protein
MEMEKVVGGYLPKTPSSGYYYPIKNVFIRGNVGEIKIIFINNNYPSTHKEFNQKNFTLTINTNLSEHLFEMKQDNKYNLKLYYNSEEIYSDNYLYHYEISFEKKPEFFEFKNDTIVDH